MQSDDFKICGLCSQLVVQSVFLEPTMRAFLLDFLNLKNLDLPIRICTDCFRASYNSQKFRENCVKAMVKLKSNTIGNEMILGHNQEDIKLIGNMEINGMDNIKKTREILEPQPVVTKSQKPKPKPVENKKVSICQENIVNSGSRSTRARSKQIAQNYSPLPTRVTRDKSVKPDPDSVTPKSSRSKMKPPKVQEVKRKDLQIIISSKEREIAEQAICQNNFSSSNRKRTKSFSSADSLLVAKKARRVKSHNKTKEIEKKAAKSQLKVSPRRKAVKTSPKALKSRPASSKKQNKSSITIEEDNKEVFPSVGPYQCEVCQVITSTKQQFVNHIKAHHMDVIDREVLGILENDLKKQKRKIQTSKPVKAAKLTPFPKASTHSERVLMNAPSENEKDALCLDEKVDTGGVGSDSKEISSPWNLEEMKKCENYQQDPIQMTDDEKSMLASAPVVTIEATPYHFMQEQMSNHSNHVESYPSFQDYLPFGINFDSINSVHC